MYFWLVSQSYLYVIEITAKYQEANMDQNTENKILATITKFLVSFFSKRSPSIEAKIEIPIDPPAPEENTPAPEIDWTNPECLVTPHFKVKDAIMLHAWNRLANDQDGLTDDGRDKLVALCNVMEQVRVYLGCPINVHCIFRSEKYNQEVVKAIPNDVHAQFLAIDFDCSPTMTIEETKEKMEQVLERFGMRMEKGTTTWVHLDLRAPGPSGRYFTA